MLQTNGEGRAKEKRLARDDLRVPADSPYSEVLGLERHHLPTTCELSPRLPAALNICTAAQFSIAAKSIFGNLGVFHHPMGN
jgi:hypothetical protein